ncbi:thiamine pyrophosphate-dependent enzyme [Aliiglaciecola sp. CAU 1673]|uniref:dehydrogenase E1 component subunit alpha/beta n=1 Tax=Aliiglaciecola sp. CAU 1673 TaxID=3032595 RepID=UPI0023DBFE70|nr:alpha-ketoacid dehydrogenase subunit alpha/beta [Aliiglaciecola sp. CAU 1673]MDF2178658.1 thiamine pyrophosphate-dependent enzyme [Aliiglaciecola sp. CAU 1673]
MLDRNAIVKDALIRALQSGELPHSPVQVSLAQAGMTAEQLVDLFETQVMSRHLDLQSRLMQKQGQSFYTIGSAGHEGNAACAAALRMDDMAFLHYRSGAFAIQRSKQKPGSTPLYDMLLSFAASAEDPISGGRHKVIGSKDLYIPPQTSTIASHLPKAAGAAYSIALAAKLGVEAQLKKDSIVVCSFGDASANHSTAQGAINAAAWTAYQSIPMPVLFICEDNGIGISTSTPTGWIQANFANRAGLAYRYCDGLNLLDTYRAVSEAAHYVRTRRMPLFLHMKVVRLLGHAGSDSEFAYRKLESIEAAERQDPLHYSARLLLDNGIMDADEIIRLYQDVEQRVAHIAQVAASRPRLQTAEQIIASVVPPKKELTNRLLDEDKRDALFAHEKHNLGKPQHLAKLINWALMDLMAQHQEIVMCGEDIGRKGGVYNVTAKLSEKFGTPRVINTLLDEQSILGLAIGMAHNGLLPIPEIQFLAYVHNAEDQIRGEAATLPFFSKGQYTNPMVIRIAGLAYQKGFGGHFHNDNSFTVFRDIPGLILACPSNGADAVSMLRECVRLAREEQRLVVFLEPIALYMKKDLHEDGDNLWSFEYLPPAQNQPVALGELGVYGEGKDLCILTYGNGYYLSRQAEKQLKEQGINCKVLDLRWLAPLNEAGIAEQTAGYDKVLIVDECRYSGSVSEALVTIVTEARQAQGQPVPQIRRITAEDSFIPLGSASYAVLPDKEEIVEAALTLVRGDQQAVREAS